MRTSHSAGPKMLHKLDFVAFVHGMKDHKDQDDRRVMARVVLNALYDAQVFPVDLSEVVRLTGKHGALARAFLSWCALNPEVYCSWTDEMCAPLTKYLGSSS